MKNFQENTNITFSCNFRLKLANVFILKRHFNIFRIRLQSRMKGVFNSGFRDYVISVFRDSSKTETGTSSGVFSDYFNISVSLKLFNIFSDVNTKNSDIIVF